MKEKTLTTTEKLFYAFLVFIYLLSIVMSRVNETYFTLHFAEEDGFVENMTALGLLIISLLQLYRAFKFGRIKPIYWKIGVLFSAALFFFAAGEEISWGQRIFNIQSGEFFTQNNAQGETNLHNLVVDGKKVNKLIFSQLLSVGLVVYLLIIPLLYDKVNWIKNLVNRFAVPLPRWHHTLWFIGFSLAVLLITSNKKWEVHEMTFAMVFFLIFLRPRNIAETYL